MFGDNAQDREELWNYAYSYTQIIRQDRTESLNGEVVDILFKLIKSGDELTVKAITNGVNEKYHELQDKLTPSKVGKILRGLGLICKHHKHSSIVDLEASADAMQHAERLYPRTEDDG